MLYPATAPSLALTDTQLGALAPAVFAERAHATTSSRYQFISTAQVVTALRSEGFVPIRAQQTRTRREDRRGHARHLVVFRAPDAVLRAVGDVTPEVVLLNAHDGTGAYQLHAGLFRLVCENGLIVSDATLAAIKVPHFGQKAVSEVIEGMHLLVSALPDVVERIAAWRATTLAPEIQLAYARQALALRYAEGTAPITPAQLLTPRRSADRLPGSVHELQRGAGAPVARRAAWSACRWPRGGDAQGHGRHRERAAQQGALDAD
jgi:uncharacterized protein DUF932